MALGFSGWSNLILICKVVRFVAGCRSDAATHIERTVFHSGVVARTTLMSMSVQPLSSPSPLQPPLQPLPSLAPLQPLSRPSPAPFQPLSALSSPSPLQPLSSPSPAPPALPQPRPRNPKVKMTNVKNKTRQNPRRKKNKTPDTNPIQFL